MGTNATPDPEEVERLLGLLSSGDLEAMKAGLKGANATDVEAAVQLADQVARSFTERQIQGFDAVLAYRREGDPPGETAFEVALARMPADEARRARLLMAGLDPDDD